LLQRSRAVLDGDLGRARMLAGEVIGATVRAPAPVLKAVP
jgi:hypothetical protein